MNKRRKAYKRRKLPTKKEKKQQIYKEVKKDVSKANARLKSLQRHVKAGSWASKKLRNRLAQQTLKAWTKSSRIRISTNMTVTQLKAVQKAINQFLKSQTSTYKGIKEVSEQTIESLEETFDLEGSNLTRSDFEDIYDLFGEKEFNDLASEIPSSDLIALMTDTRDYNYSEDDFLVRLNTLKSINDIDLRDKATKLYNKLMR